MFGEYGNLAAGYSKSSTFDPDAQGLQIDAGVAGGEVRDRFGSI